MRFSDEYAKAKMKLYAAAKASVKPSEITKGDSVLLKNNRTTARGKSAYDPAPYEMKERKGSMVTAQRGDHKVDHTPDECDIQPQPAITCNHNVYNHHHNNNTLLRKSCLQRVDQEGKPKHHNASKTLSWTSNNDILWTYWI